MSPQISVLITNYNTWPQTQQCIQELERWSGDQIHQILVIDDASTQPPPEDLPARVRVSRNPQNRGYVGSVNVGFGQLEEDLVLVMDSDAYPMMDLIPPILQAFTEEPHLGILGFSLVDRQGHPTGSHELEPDVMGLFLGQKLDGYWGQWIRPLYCRQFTIFSCAMAVRRQAFVQIGGFDESFDFLDGDVDFSMRMAAAGWRVRRDQTLVACHEGGGSPQTMARRVVRHYRNRWRLLHKHGRLAWPWALKPGLAARHATELAILSSLGRILFPDRAVLEDKVSSRRQLLNEVWSGYGNES